MMCIILKSGDRKQTIGGVFSYVRALEGTQHEIRGFRVRVRRFEEASVFSVVNRRTNELFEAINVYIMCVYSLLFFF